MPHYCYVRTDLRCPRCDVVITDLVWFQWGYSPGRLSQEEYIYDLNDPICWRYCPDKGIYSWVYFKDEGGRPQGANFGDPHIRDLVVRDPEQFYWGWDPDKRYRCVNCERPIDGAAIEIRDNHIQRAWIYEPGEFDDKADCYLIRDAERYVPMPEWKDHLMPAIEGCSGWRLVVPYVENEFLQIPSH